MRDSLRAHQSPRRLEIWRLYAVFDTAFGGQTCSVSRRVSAHSIVIVQFIHWFVIPALPYFVSSRLSSFLVSFLIYILFSSFFIFPSFVSFSSPVSSSLCESCLCLFFWFGVSSRGLRPSRLFNKDAQTDSLVVDFVFGWVGETAGDNCSYS